MPCIDPSAAAIAVLFVLVLVKPVHGQGSLALNQPSSTLVASGNVSGSPFTPQGPGSLSTTYTGTIGVAALDLTAATLTIDSSATAWTAAVSGSWMPMANGVAGSANYGAQAVVPVTPFLTTTVLAAVRDASLTIAGSPTVALTPAGPGSFTFPANQTLQFLTGSLDYRDSVGIAAPGRIDLTNQSSTNSPATPATLQDLGGNEYNLTYPVDVTINSTINPPGVQVFLRIQGTITAQGTITPVPEPSLVLSVCLGAFGATAVWRRGRLAPGMRTARSG